MEKAFNELIKFLIDKTKNGNDYVEAPDGRNTIKGYWDNIRNYLNGEQGLFLDDVEIRQVVESIKQQYGNNNNYEETVTRADEIIEDWIDTGNRDLLEEPNVNMAGGLRRSRRRHRRRKTLRRVRRSLRRRRSVRR